MCSFSKIAKNEYHSTLLYTVIVQHTFSVRSMYTDSKYPLESSLKLLSYLNIVFIMHIYCRRLVCHLADIPGDTYIRMVSFPLLGGEHV